MISCYLNWYVHVLKSAGLQKKDKLFRSYMYWISINQISGMSVGMQGNMGMQAGMMGNMPVGSMGMQSKMMGQSQFQQKTDAAFSAFGNFGKKWSKVHMF